MPTPIDVSTDALGYAQPRQGRAVISEILSRSESLPGPCRPRRPRQPWLASYPLALHEFGTRLRIPPRMRPPT